MLDELYLSKTIRFLKIQNNYLKECNTSFSTEVKTLVGNVAHKCKEWVRSVFAFCIGLSKTAQRGDFLHTSVSEGRNI